MNTQIKLFIGALLCFVSISFNGQVVIDDYNNCQGNPDQFTVTQIMGNADFQTQEVFPGECELVYLGAPNFSVTEALYQPIDLTQPVYGLNPGEPVDIQFNLNYDGSNPNPGNVLKFVVFDPNPVELVQIPLDLPASGPVLFPLPDVGMLNNPFAFVVEGFDTPNLFIDDLEVLPLDPQDPCPIIGGELDMNPPTVPLGPGPCDEYAGMLVYITGVGETTFETPVFCPDNSTLPEQVLGLPGLVTDSSTFTAEGITVLIIFIYVPKDCDDGDPCTYDYCNPTTGECMNVPYWSFEYNNPPAPAGPCEVYIGSEATANGVLVASSVPVGYQMGENDTAVISSDTELDGTDPVCEWIVAHYYGPIDCDDGDPCTADFCVEGECVHIPAWEAELTPPPTPDPCYEYIGVEVVANFVYQEAYSTVPLDYIANPDPNEIVEITSETLVEDNVVICDWIVSHVFAPINCDDGDPCTADSCVDGVCVHVPAWEAALTPPPSPGPCYAYLGVEVIANFVYQDAVSTVPMSYIANPHPDEIVHITSETQVEDNVVICDWIVSHTFVPIDCDDGDPCTDDVCIDGVCHHIPKWEEALAPPAAPEPCYDYLGVEVVVNFVYQSDLSTVPAGYTPDPSHINAIESGTTVEDNVVVCDWIVNHVFVPRDCDDGDPCTYDYCDPETNTCVHEPAWEEGLEPLSPGACYDYLGYEVYTTGLPFPIESSLPPGYTPDGDDTTTEIGGSVLDGEDIVCTWWVVHYWSPKNCNDGDPCTIDSCDPATGDCVHTPVVITVTTQVTAARCPDYDNGSIVVTASGGTGPYTILLNKVWSLTILGPNIDPDAGGDNDTETFTGLTPGVYKITVVDANGCSKSHIEIVGEESEINLYYSEVKPVCWEDCNGSIQYGVEFGTQPFMTTFEQLQDDGTWGPSQAADQVVDGGNIVTYTYDDLCRGTYRFTVVDANGCSETQTTTLVPLNTKITMDADGTSQTCPGPCAGQIDITAGGGSQPTTYQYTIDGGTTWNNMGGNTVQVNGLCGGAYEVQVRNAQGCLSDPDLIFLMQPADWDYAIATTDVLCNDDEDGTATIEWTGGTPPYRTIFEGDTANAPIVGGVLMPSATFGVGKWTKDNMGPGGYTIWVVDDNNCTRDFTITITEPDPLDTFIHVVGESTEGDNGFIDTETSGGTPPYTHYWYHNDSLWFNTPDIYDLEPGRWEHWVIDDHGCTDSLGVDLGGTPLETDSDEDGLIDWEEENEYNTNIADPDTDGDLLTDWEEIHIYGTDPNNPDTDGDGVQDGDEVHFTGTDPLVPDNGTEALTGGCTYLDALNYDIDADFEDGSCVFDTTETCAGDADGDGEISTSDLLAVLGGFGSSCEP